MNRHVRRIIPYCFGLLLWLPGKSTAQRVIYSQTIHTRGAIRLRVVGKSENSYWVEKLQKQKSKSNSVADGDDVIQGLGLFDAHLNLMEEQLPVTIPETMKQWLMTGTGSLDQIVVAHSGDQLIITCNRYRENQIAETKSIDSLSFLSAPSCLLLVRSEDQTKNLLIAFENTDPDITRVHAILFDADWHTLYHRIISDIQMSQPCIQDEFIGFPSESFDNLPVKLANNGEWLMAFPSRVSHNFSLFHASPDGSGFSFNEIPVSPFYKMEDVSMSIDNQKKELNLGLLSAYRNTSLKNVQVYNYSISRSQFTFDSSYHFNELHRDLQSKNLSHESFTAIPGGGYMLLKEYGSPFEPEKPDIPLVNNWEATYLMANYAESNTEKNENGKGYLLNRGLTPLSMVRNRGDLNIFYFPGVSKDSTWSGIISTEQQAETNNPDLSYLMMPLKNKLYLIYNSPEGFTDPIATTTTLNLRGEATGDALVFWKMDKLLNFQHARRFSQDEVAVPYRDNQQSGFAIIRLR